MKLSCACALLLALSLNGCSCSQRGTPGDDDGDGGARDAATGDGAHDGAPLDGRRDGAARPDGGLPWDAGTCEQPWSWELVDLPVVAVSLANGAPPRVGVTEQLVVEVQLLSGSCMALAGVELTLMPGNATDFVELRARAWSVAGSVPCTPDAPIVSTVVTIPGRWQGNLRVVVADASDPGGGTLLTWQRDYCSGLPDCQCSAGSPDGPGQEHATCLTDCSCAAGLSCIGALGFAGAGWSCRRPCADDRDCAAGAYCLRHVADSAAYVCEPGGQCGDGVDCPEGFACRPQADGVKVCEDLRSAPTMLECTCDAQCPPGERCSLTFGDSPRCAVWCETDADCPLEGQGWLVCGTPAVCLPLE